jgi:hypothetical protein
MAPERYIHPEPQHTAPFGKRVFAAVIKVSPIELCPPTYTLKHPTPAPQNVDIAAVRAFTEVTR